VSKHATEFMALKEKRTGASNAPLDHTSKYANTDAACQDEISSGGLGFIVRNGTGGAIAAGRVAGTCVCPTC
jgi:hypothetical protein